MLERNLLLLLFLGVFLNFTYAARFTHTTSKIHTATTTSTVTKGVLVLTVFDDVYYATTMRTTVSSGVLLRKSASSASTILVLTKTSSAKSTLSTPSSAKTTTSVIFSSSAKMSTKITKTTDSSVSQNSSKNPLVTSSIIVSTKNSATINTNTLTKLTTISTAVVTSAKSSVKLTSTSKSSSSSKVTSTSKSSSKVTTTSKSSSKVTSTSKSSSKVTTTSKSSSKVTSTSKSSSKVTSTSKSSSKVTSTSKSSSKVTSTSKSSSKVTSTSKTSSLKATSTLAPYSGDLFKVIDTSAPPSVFPREELYLEPASGVDNGNTPYETNKFYTNMMLDDQTDTVFTYPYSVWFVKDTYYGLAAGHTTSSQYAYGNHTWATDAYGYYFNPLDNDQLIFSATTFGSSVTLGLTEMKEFSALATLAVSSSTTNYIQFPLVQGMGFVTGIYHGNLIPRFNTQMAILTFAKETSSNLASGILKYRVSLNNGVSWLIYVTLPTGYSSTSFSLSVSGNVITGSKAIDGLTIQVAVAPSSTASDIYYDEAAGMYATSAVVSGSVSNGVTAEYLITYSTSGLSLSGTIIAFLLPHQVESLSTSFAGIATGISLDSTTKGKMHGYLTNQVIMSETLETEIQFLPWVSGMGELSYTAAQLKLIASTANSELAVDIEETVNSLNSNYYSGKVIDKYAYILLTVSEIIGDNTTAKSTLADMKYAFSRFFNNTQYYPLMYDTRYKGVTSSGAQTSEDSGVDFGSPIYNDHHFHYGYFIHAAAVVGYVDAKFGGSWAKDNKAWVNSLIRDVANPSSSDSYFPVSRMFDWFHGHSWAAGLASSGDGKNQESSSEDYNFAYGMKLWGKVIGDQSMESRGDLMLAISKRSMNKYYLYSDDNSVEPADFIPNKVAGIIFDNKIDYTTYFGSNLEYIHGIHMLPITPASSLIRGKTFVQQEWNEKLKSLVGSLSSGWAGVLRLNQALIDAATSYSFFSSSSFTSAYLDNGQSRTWCLAFSGGISNAV